MDKVSVIITTYKADDCLSNAINSVLEQTYSNIEIIVVDDNNPETDGRKFTEDLMQKYADNKTVHYIKHEKNKNGAAARNTGLTIATGDYIAFLDDDDYYYPDRIEKCVRTLNLKDNYNAVYTSVEVYRNGKLMKTRIAEKSGKLWKDLLLNEGMLGTGSNIFLRKTPYVTNETFDERFLRYQDVEYMLRFLRNNAIVAVDEVLVRKNIRGVTTTNIPEYVKYKRNKELIFAKFNELILELSDDEKKRFYEYHYLALFNSAIMSCNRKYIKESKKALDEIGYFFSHKQKICSLLPEVYKQYLKFRLKE